MRPRHRLIRLAFVVGTLTAQDNAAGGAAISCPTGTRALSGGQAIASGSHSDPDRLALDGPFVTPTELDAVASGAVPRAWSAYGQSDVN